MRPIKIKNSLSVGMFKNKISNWEPNNSKLVKIIDS